VGYSFWPFTLQTQRGPEPFRVPAPYPRLLTGAAGTGLFGVLRDLPNPVFRDLREHEIRADGLSGEFPNGPLVAFLVLIGVALEVALNDYAVALAQRRSDVFGQKTPCGDVVEIGSRVNPLLGVGVERLPVQRDGELNARIPGRGETEFRISREVADDSYRNSSVVRHDFALIFSVWNI